NLKAKRKRASPEQLAALNEVFFKTIFPSTDLRNQLAQQLAMTPRAVQIWFQNKRQTWRTKQR
ncbi:homeobox domain-containing protein, partial [Phlyctochytrium arcticum]